MAGRIQTEATKLVGSPLLARMLVSAHAQGKGDPTLRLSYVVVAIDPGETTGFTVYYPWEECTTIHHYQLETKTVEQGWEALEEHWPRPIDCKGYQIIVVCEDYKVYAWKSTDHSWNKLHTSQFIGAIRILCYQKTIPIVFQMAGQAKGWATDEKLKLWGLYEPGLKHARDACRHLITYLFFGKRPTLMVTESEDKESGSWAT